MAAGLLSKRFLDADVTQCVTCLVVAPSTKLRKCGKCGFFAHAKCSRPCTQCCFMYCLHCWRKAAEKCPGVCDVRRIVACDKCKVQYCGNRCLKCEPIEDYPDLTNAVEEDSPKRQRTAGSFTPMTVQEQVQKAVNEAHEKGIEVLDIMTFHKMNSWNELHKDEYPVYFDGVKWDPKTLLGVKRYTLLESRYFDEDTGHGCDLPNGCVRLFLK